ncbi:hypothetical protein KY290_005315 [Solanum tuberosum]|uniref:Uncharacterized protein n=1 Tax=Solanum tuberosum TaxID=4113 RepID=A0ABQ7WFK9_SOLTU|nr:hypothetical protein KY289_005701 [Solanum tuberosum]KAH0778888.1 hypothetical protein KY290_005315 [Solanum tuberosum]
MDIQQDHSQVKSVMQPVNEDGWDHAMLQANFNEDVCIHIHNVLKNLVLTQGRDKPWWMPSGSGKFKVGTTWDLCRYRKEPIENISNIWVKGLPYKVSFLL